MFKLQQQDGRRLPRLATRGSRGALALVVGHASLAPSRDELPVYVFDVRVAIIVPVQAKAGDALVIRPGDVTVMDRRGAAPVPVRASALDAPALLRLVQCGALTPRSEASRPGLEALAARKGPGSSSMICATRVLRDIATPVTAQVGQIIVLTDTPSRTLVVFDAAGDQVLRECAETPDGRVARGFHALLAEGALSFLQGAS